MNDQHRDEPAGAPPGATWLRALRRYALASAGMHLAWEILQLPLYTIYASPLRTRAWAVLHCTAGDILIAIGALVAALLLAGDRAWPARRFYPVAALALPFGLAYTIYSEWLNVSVRGAWAYAAAMPTSPISGFDLGVTPVLQWIIVPAAALALLRPIGSRAAPPPSRP